MNNWFNTINLEGEDLKRENANAKAIEVVIEAIFKANPDKELSPSQLLSILGKKYFRHPPITSVRRGLTNLSNKAKYEKQNKIAPLVKTDTKVPGLYHLNEHCWKLSGTTENIYKNGIETAGDLAKKIIKTTVTQSLLF